jgi:hypothetical protein
MCVWEMSDMRSDEVVKELSIQEEDSNWASSSPKMIWSNLTIWGSNRYQSKQSLSLSFPSVSKNVRYLYEVKFAKKLSIQEEDSNWTYVTSSMIWSNLTIRGSNRQSIKPISQSHMCVRECQICEVKFAKELSIQEKIVTVTFNMTDLTWTSEDQVDYTSSNSPLMLMFVRENVR